MISPVIKQNETTISELYDLRYEVHEACTEKSSFMLREQVIRFENILRFYSSKYELNNRYENAVKEMKLMLFRQIDYARVQKRLLEELRRLTLDVNYLSY